MASIQENTVCNSNLLGSLKYVIHQNHENNAVAISNLGFSSNRSTARFTNNDNKTFVAIKKVSHSS